MDYYWILSACFGKVSINMKKRFCKRILSVVLAVLLFATMCPVPVNAAYGDTVRIYVTNANGTRLPNATVTVTYKPGRWGVAFQRTVTNVGNGEYTFVSNGNGDYTIAVECDGYDAYSQTFSNTNPGKNTVYNVMLTGYTPQYVTFNIFYFISSDENKVFPDSYFGAGDQGSYGPSRNNTPLVSIDVDINQLKTMEGVQYVEDSGNQYHFIPDGEAQSMEAAQKFWDAVCQCTSEESKKAFAATGLDTSFVGYCLKKQNDGSCHGDGVLSVTPPIYVIEMYHNNVYFAGEATDADVAGMDVYDLLAFCEDYLQQTITWTEDEYGRPALVDGKYMGDYISNGRFYKVTITQRAMSNPSDHPSGLQYDKISDQYYLAMFDVDVIDAGPVQYTVTYTDGVADQVVYNDHQYPASWGENVPAYRGIYTRKDYAFAGWVQAGGDGTLLSDADVQAMKVYSDMTFHAAWVPVPKYTGTVELVLNGTYDAATHTATGQRIDAEAIRGEGVKLYVKEENALDDYILLEKVAGKTGVYSTTLPNGNYYFYYTKDEGQTMVSTGNQQLTINNEDRVRYLFYNSVTYDLNGGTGGPGNTTEYHRSGYSVNVSELIPTKDGYVFMGWKDQDGELYQSGTELTGDISKAYTLTAQWKTVTRATVNLTLQINHAGLTGEGVDPNPGGTLTMNLMYRTKGSDEPYVEVVGEYKTESSWYDSDPDINDTTTVTYAPFYADLSTDYEYSANAILTHYWNVDRTVTQTTDDKGNVTYDVVIQLQYNPDLFALHYNVVLDESVPDDTVDAADIKIISWDARVAGQWAPIRRHENYSVDVNTVDREGEGSYNVPAHKKDQEHYYYRVRPVGFTLHDGTELLVTGERLDDENNVVYYLSDPSGKYAKGAFYAKVNVTGGASDVDGQGANAAYAEPVGDDHVQAGTITVTVYANSYNVTFDPNGGALPQDKENPLKKQFYVPALNEYTPTREGGYVFEGWYLADGEGNMTDETVASFAPLEKDITLIAKWRDPITVRGEIAVAGFYQMTDENGNTSTHIIQDAGRPTQVVVALQHIDANGYAETYYTKTVQLTYGEDHMGTGHYEFTGLHDEDHDHRILVLEPNYSTRYQNEPDSIDPAKVTDYEGAYHDPTDYDPSVGPHFIVVKGTDDPSVAVINAYLYFTPESFELQYQVDASRIGDGFRPNVAEILVTCDTDPRIVASHEWAVISQMVYGDQLRGNDVTLDAQGKGSGTLDAWKSFPDGVSLYDYGLRLHSTTAENAYTENAYTLYDENTACFTVEYQAPAHWTESGQQSQMLIATLVPKQYPIHYKLNGGTLTASCPAAHTWSYETQLSDAVPVRTGYAFAGWYLDAEFNTEAPQAIAAGTALETELYAKWIEARDQVTLHVTINHQHQHEDDSSVNDTFDSDLVLQLRRKDRDSADSFEDVSAMVKRYAPTFWHTNTTDDVEECYIYPAFSDLENIYDYTLDVSLGGYHLAAEPVVTKITNEDGSTTHAVEVVLAFAPDLFYMEFSVEMHQDMPVHLDPVHADVAVICFDHTETQTWKKIDTVHVDIDPDARKGTGGYYLWQWDHEPDPETADPGVPYYYRIVPEMLVFENGTKLPLSGTDFVNYTGQQGTAGEPYSAVVEDYNCSNDNDNNTDLKGVYGTLAGQLDGKDHYVQTGTIKAVINAYEQPVIFHANIADVFTGDADIFRTYYPAGRTDEEYNLNTDGTITGFYDIPVFADKHTGNTYIFKGWYLDPDSDDRPITFAGSDAVQVYAEKEDATVFAGVRDVYARWITVGTVDKNPEDGKGYAGGKYAEYDLLGVQIREAQTDSLDKPSYIGTVGAGLRFVAVLSQNVYDQLQGLSDKNPIVARENSDSTPTMEYGFAVATKSATDKRVNGDSSYELLYKGQNVNGRDTLTDYKYAQNMVCSGPTIVDHYSDDNYRLYTAVITYGSAAAQALKDTPFVARAYLRYHDANGLYRTHFHTYEGATDASTVYGGVSISYNKALSLVTPSAQE